MASHAAASYCLGATRPARSSQWGGIAVEVQSRQARFRSMAARASVNVQPFGSPPPPAAAAAAAPDLQALQQQLESAAQRVQSTASGVQLPDVQLPTSIDTQQAATVAAQAAGAAAEALGRTAAAAAAPLDVFGGQWALNLLFVAVLLVFAYSLIALAPRQ